MLFKKKKFLPPQKIPSNLRQLHLWRIPINVSLANEIIGISYDVFFHVLCAILGTSKQSV